MIPVKNEEINSFGGTVRCIPSVMALYTSVCSFYCHQCVQCLICCSPLWCRNLNITRLLETFLKEVQCWNMVLAHWMKVVTRWTSISASLHSKVFVLMEEENIVKQNIFSGLLSACTNIQRLFYDPVYTLPSIPRWCHCWLFGWFPECAQNKGITYCNEIRYLQTNFVSWLEPAVDRCNEAVQWCHGILFS